MALVVGPGEPDNVEFGALLAQFRRDAGFSRSRAAQALDLSSEYIRLFERGKRVPAYWNMEKILNTYGIIHSHKGERTLIIGDTTVIFTSRILEKRGEKLPLRPTQRMRPGRSRKIGSIVELLVYADDETLTDIYNKLQGE